MLMVSLIGTAPLPSIPLSDTLIRGWLLK